MARFRLRGKHYINIIHPQAEWEHKELNQSTGKEARKRFQVPTHLDPEEPSDCNYPGEVIVATKEDRAHPRDYVFVGPPSPDMEPLDDEAQALYDEESRKWIHRDVIPGEYTQSLLESLHRQLDAAQANQPVRAAAAVPASMVSKEDFDALQAQVAALMAQNAELKQRRV